MKNQLKVLLAFATVSVSSLYGAIDIVSPPVPNPFTAVPPTDQWTTLTVGTATDATITTPELFDAKIIAAANAANIITVLGSSPTIPPQRERHRPAEHGGEHRRHELSPDPPHGE